MKKLLFFIVLVGVCLQACKRKCRDVQSNRAEFRTYTVIRGVERNGKPTNVIAEEDTFFVGGSIIIESLVENALKYEWKIQGDPELREGKKIALYFQEPSVLPGDSLEIMSIVTRKPNLECIAGDDGVDTLVKKIYFIDFLNAPFAGKYRVHDEINDPGNYYDLIIRYQPYDNTFNGPIMRYLIDSDLLLQEKPGMIYSIDYPNCFAFAIYEGVWSKFGYTPTYVPTYTTGLPYGYLSKDRKQITIEGTFLNVQTDRNFKFKITGSRIN
ncbi:MAG: hypothetical protein NZ516_07225 [Raineya sp.]|nr:hypothetical protein [Raineya sp.]